MIMDAQQEYFTAFKLALLDQGFSVYDDSLPPEGTPYPFIYLAETRQDGYSAKGQMAGYITLIVQVWDRASKRGSISRNSMLVRETARRLTQTEHYAYDLRDTEQRIIPDNTTKTPLMQGWTSLRVFFSRR